MKTLYYHTAEWCAPCVKLKPLVKKLCLDRGVVFDERDIDDSDKPPMLPDLMGFPTIVIREEGADDIVLRPEVATRLSNVKKALDD